MRINKHIVGGGIKLNFNLISNYNFISHNDFTRYIINDKKGLWIVSVMCVLLILITICDIYEGKINGSKAIVIFSFIIFIWFD